MGSAKTPAAVKARPPLKQVNVSLPLFLHLHAVYSKNENSISQFNTEKPVTKLIYF